MTTEHQIKTTVHLILYYNAAQRWQYRMKRINQLQAKQ